VTRLKAKRGTYGLNRVRKYFPAVETVSDAKKGVSINVTEVDCSGAKKGDFTSCALAKACRRQFKADGAIVGISYSYLVTGSHATRFRTPPSVAREIITFDRHNDFDIGTYQLCRVSPSARLGTRPDNPTGKHDAAIRIKYIVHHTSRVRRQP